jgi:hypothetical protein
MWMVVLLALLLWWITRIQEGYTEITPSIIDITAQVNSKVKLDEFKINNLNEAIDHQTEQLGKIDSIIAQINAQKNNP